MGQHDDSLANMLPKFCEQTAASRIALIIHCHSGDDNFIAPRLQNTQAAVIISSDITSWNMYSHLDIPQIRRYVLKSRCKSTICFILASTSWSTDEMLLETSQKLSLLGNSVSLIYAKNRTTSLARYQAVPSMPASCPAVQRRKCVIRCDSPSCCEYSSVTQCPKDPKHNKCMSKCVRVFGTCQWQMISRELLTSCPHWHLGTAFLAKMPMAIGAARSACVAWALWHSTDRLDAKVKVCDGHLCQYKTSWVDNHWETFVWKYVQILHPWINLKEFQMIYSEV